VIASILSFRFIVAAALALPISWQIVAGSNAGGDVTNDREEQVCAIQRSSIRVVDDSDPWARQRALESLRLDSCPRGDWCWMCGYWMWVPQ
jgi:hypothetical protein